MTVTFERTSYVVSETDKQLTIVIGATGNFDGPITLMLAVSPETDDYTLETLGTIRPTLSQFPFEVIISITDDCVEENNETFIVSLTSPVQPGVKIVNDRASITVLDRPVKEDGKKFYYAKFCFSRRLTLYVGVAQVKSHVIRPQKHVKTRQDCLPKCPAATFKPISSPTGSYTLSVWHPRIRTRTTLRFSCHHSSTSCSLVNQLATYWNLSKRWYFH